MFYMNTIKNFLETREDQGTMHIGDLAEYGVMNLGHRELMYNEDIINFFDNYYTDIENTIIDYVESVSGGEYYDLTNMELMSDLNSYTNVEFTTEDEMLDMLHEKAFKQAELDNAAEWDDMDEEEQEELIFDYMDDVEVLPTDQDKINFVCLAVELVAQNIIEDRDL